MKPIRALLTVAISLALIRDDQAKDTLADGLVAYYPFNGNANDESGNGWDGVGSPIPTEDRFGQPDSAYAFSELSHYILIPGSEGLHLESALSFSVWFKSTYTGPDENFMLGKHRSGFRNGHFINANQGTEELGVSVGDTNHHTVSILDLSLFDGSWHHLACTYDGWTAQLYMDGSLCDT